MKERVSTRNSNHAATAEATEQDILRAAGLRVTAARLEVLALLRAANKPMAHGEVVDALDGRPWDRATLYRNLIDLSDAGLLSRVSLGSAWHFEFSPAGGNHIDPHPHFVCTECGTVSCAPGVALQIEAGQESAKSIRKGEVQVQLHGLCDDCD